jgi:hypothetical protein
MTYKAPFAALVVAAAMILPGLPAQALSGTQQEQAACRPDVTKHCKGIQGDDENAFVACLVSHAPQLSKRCHKVLQDHGKLPPG